MNYLMIWRKLKQVKVAGHRLIDITDRTLDVVFSRFGFGKIVHNKPEAEALRSFVQSV